MKLTWDTNKIKIWDSEIWPPNWQNDEVFSGATYTDANKILWVQMVEPSDTISDTTILLTSPSDPDSLTDQIKVTSVNIDLIEPTVDEDHEINPGAFIMRNIDDDDSDSLPDFSQDMTDARLAVENGDVRNLEIIVNPPGLRDYGYVYLCFSHFFINIYEKDVDVWSKYQTSPINLKENGLYCYEGKGNVEGSLIGIRFMPSGNANPDIEDYLRVNVVTLSTSDFDPMVEELSDDTTPEEKEVSISVDPSGCFSALAPQLTFVLENEKDLTGATKDVAELLDSSIGGADNKIKIKAKGYGEAELVAYVGSFDLMKAHFVVLKGRRPTAAEIQWTVDWEIDGLIEGEWSVILPPSSVYNCVAWSGGWDSKNINPYATEGEWDVFYAGLSSHGPCPDWPSGLWTVGIVFYIPPSDACAVIMKKGSAYTHAYKKWGLGYYSSKLGSGIGVIHKPEQMNCTLYGDACRYYKP